MKDYNYMLEARSKKDGIVFYSKKCPMLGLEAFYDENEKNRENRKSVTHPNFDKGLQFTLTCPIFVV